MEHGTCCGTTWEAWNSCYNPHFQIFLMLVIWNSQASLNTLLTVDFSLSFAFTDSSIVCDSLIMCTIVPNYVLIFLWSLWLPRHDHWLSELACFKCKQLKAAEVPNRNNIWKKCIWVQSIIYSSRYSAPYPCLEIIPQIFPTLSLDSRYYLGYYSKGSLCSLKGGVSLSFSPNLNPHFYMSFI